MAGATYGTSCFDHYFAPGRALPRVDCARPSGAPLPNRAVELVRAGMCCVLERARLWPAAEDAWGHADYLKRELRSCPCAVLDSPSSSRRFSYWFDQSSYGSDRVNGGYRAKPLVRSVTMSIDQYLDAQGAAAGQQPPQDRCLYLQQSILQAPADGSAQQGNLQPCVGLGEGMRRDIAAGIDLGALRTLSQAGGFGPWQRCQLFVGGASAIGARSILHFDQYDNLFVQIRGHKRFKIYDPHQTRCVYPYPIHHPLDTRAQVDLEAPDLAAYPKLAEARCSEIVLAPGQALFLPAYWWHEVITEPDEPGQGGGGPGGDPGGSGPYLCVSVNFWFAAVSRLLTPTRPLVPSMQVELARQLEYLISDTFADRAQLVPAFLSATRAAIQAVHTLAAAAAAATATESSSGSAAPPFAPMVAARDAGDAARDALHAQRPAAVRGEEWQGLFEFVLCKLGLLIGHRQMLAFCDDLLDQNRFAHLRREAEGSRR